MENRRRTPKSPASLNERLRGSATQKNRLRRNSPLAAPAPAKKRGWFSRGRSQNTYRRGNKPEGKRSWLRLLLVSLGLAGAVGLCLGLVFFYHQLLTCSAFCIKDIKNIEIQGAHRLSPETILHLAKVGPNTNLLAVRPARVEHALLSHPWIARAEVTRKFPHRLQVKITEREPVALVQLNDELFYLGRQGSLFKLLSPGDPHNFPVITGLKPENFHFTAGAMPDILAQVFQLLEVLKTAAPPLNLENISEIHADSERGFSLYANGLGGALDLGFKDYALKLKKFARIWPALAQKGYAAKIGRINLDYPQRVLVTLKGMEEN
jgi:cell division protein FtsQ